MIFLIVLLLIVFYLVYDPFIDVYTDVNGMHIILWYKSDNERKYIVLY